MCAIKLARWHCDNLQKESVLTLLRAAGIALHQRRRNCKQCTLDGSKDNKTVYMCEKCKVPLHTYCFKRYHVM